MKEYTKSPTRLAFEKFRDEQNAKLEAEGHKPGSKWHVNNAHYATWEAANKTHILDVPGWTVEHLLAEVDTINVRREDGRWCSGGTGVDTGRNALIYEFMVALCTRYNVEPMDLNGWG